MKTSSLLALGLCSLAACSGDGFDPSWRVDAPRILALRADPPLIELGGEVSLSALVIDGQGRQVDQAVTWRACNPWNYVLNPDVDCGAAVALPVDGTLSFAAVLEAFPPPVGVTVPGGGTLLDPCLDGPSFALPIVAEVVVDGRRLLARKEIPVAIRAGEPSHRNPRIAGVLLNGAEAIGYIRGERYTVDVELDESALDQVCDDGETSLEDVRVNLYTTDGDLEEGSVDLEWFADGTSSAEQTTWTAPEGDAATIWLIAVDPAGGIDWLPVALAAGAR